MVAREVGRDGGEHEHGHNEGSLEGGAAWGYRVLVGGFFQRMSSYEARMPCWDRGLLRGSEICSIPKLMAAPMVEMIWRGSM